MNDETLIDWIQLSRSPNVGPVTFSHLLHKFGSAAHALEALPALAQKGGARSIKILPRSIAEAELNTARKKNIHLITKDNEQYPKILLTIDGAPPILSVIGQVEILQRQIIGLVGSRNASAAGRKMARILASGVADQGYATVSGLARGIDAAVHEASINTGTIAVLAGGVDRIYPPEHEELYEKIQELGCVISEMPIGSTPRSQDFPRRNRIIAGLCLAMVVVEAAERSGSLISARMATEMNKEVCAVPGSPLDPRASGTNRLLRDGASVITCAQDIIDAIHTPKSRVQMDFGFKEAEITQPYTVKSPEEIDSFHDHILNALSPSPIDIDVLSRELSCPIGNINTALLEMELAGKVVRYTGNRVSLSIDV